jgi:uncharacterized OB-fold protein
MTMVPLEPLPSGQSTDLHLDAEPGVRTALRATRCPACKRHSFPARNLCPACGTPTEGVILDGPARLRVLTGVRAQPPGSLVAAPYDVGVAEFDEGICVIGLVYGPAERGDSVVPVVVEPYVGGRIFGFRREQG